MSEYSNTFDDGGGGMDPMAECAVCRLIDDIRAAGERVVLTPEVRIMPPGIYWAVMVLGALFDSIGEVFS